MRTTDTPHLPSRREIEAALASQRDLAALLNTKTEIHRIQVCDEKGRRHAVDLPTSAVRLLLDILGELAEGNAVKVVPIHAEVTTQEAADLLNVSRPHLVKLLEGGELSFHRTGKHRRIRFADLLAYKARRDARSEAALAVLAKEAQELGMGYE